MSFTGGEDIVATRKRPDATCQLIVAHRVYSLDCRFMSGVAGRLPLRVHRVFDAKDVKQVNIGATSTQPKQLLRLQVRLDGPQHLETHCAALVRQRNDEADPPISRRIGVSRQGADAGQCTGLV